VALKGRDLHKLRSQITSDSDGTATLKMKGPEANILTLIVVQEEEWLLCASKEEIPEMSELPFKIPEVWAEDNPYKLAQNIPLLVVELKPGAILVSQRQYYIPCKAQIWIQKHLDRLLKYGVLQPCQSPWNTPLLPVQKPGTEDFRPVQDLHTTNSATITLHRVVPNHTRFWALSQLRQSTLPAWTLRMHFSASAWPTGPTHLCLPMGKFLYWRKGTIDLDPVATRLQKTLSLSLELPWCPT
jgi:hypothetical protein